MALRHRRGAGLRRAARGRTGSALGLTGLYGGAALLGAWPGLLSFRSAYLAGGADGNGEAAPGDHGQVVYRLWLVGHRLADGETPWRDPYSFQPLVEPQLVLAGWPFGLPFWPLEAAFGPVVAWNVLLLGTVVLAGVCTYGWLRTLDVAPLAAAVGGLAFAIAPYRLAQSSDHVLGWVAALLPLVLLGIERSRAAETRREANLWGAVAALALASFSMSGQVHLALGVLPLAVAYAALRFSLTAFAWTATGALVTGAAGLALRFTLIEGAELGETRSLEYVDAYSAEPLDFLNRWHPAPSEELVYLGWLLPFLALGGLVVLVREGRRTLAVALAVAAVLPILLALGTNLPLYAPVRTVVSPLQSARVPSRFMAVAALALAALAAFAVAWLLARAGPRRAVATGAALLVLVTADLTIMPLSPTPADLGNEAYAALAERPPGRMLDLPVYEPGRNEGAVHDLYALQAPRERPTGYSSVAPAETFGFYFEFGRLTCGAWLPGDEEELRRLDVTTFLFHRGLYARDVAGSWFAWNALEERGWREVERHGAVSLLARGSGQAVTSRLAEPDRDKPYFCRGWNRLRRMVEPYASLWLHGAGRFELDLRSTKPTRLLLWIDGRREREVTVNGRAFVTFALTGERWHSVLFEVPGPLEVPPRPGIEMARISFP